ncbi:f-box-like domain-containing protein [Ditylenchus destructor]|uniref:F-box-like domain-containing protein n=1 Tax=Ditylenchus destructor TaxID=166010 RepID=A0AAD4N3I8_9BILA|nr:f-box-like domain-containing protein [Ditylenchus destructor]
MSEPLHPGSKEDFINNLPDEKLAEIFKWLPIRERFRLSRVCRRWSRIRPTCITTFDSACCRKMTLPRMGVLAKRFRSLRQAFIRNREKDMLENKIVCKGVLSLCGLYLRCLTLRDFSSTCVVELISQTPNLQHLRIMGDNLSVKRLEKVAGLLPSLRSLELNLSSQATKLSVKYNALSRMEGEVISKCHKLEYLSLGNSSKTHKEFLFPANLKYLDLRYANGRSNYYLKQAVRYCKNVEAIHLPFVYEPCEKTLQFLGQVSGLTFLAIYFHTMYFQRHPEPFSRFCSRLSHLRALELCSANVTTLSEISRCCKQLEHLSFHIFQIGITDDNWTEVLSLAALPKLCSLSIILMHFNKTQYTEFFSSLAAKGNLQYIKVTTYHSSRTLIPVESVCELLQSCKELQYIDLDIDNENGDSYTKLCQTVDKIEEMDRDLAPASRRNGLAAQIKVCKNMPEVEKYKWLHFMKRVPRSPIHTKWQWGCLSAGKPKWFDE